MSKSTRLLIFLLASFVSAVGDSLLLFAVPLGLGLETKQLSSVVLMWLIPAVAVFAASFLHKQVRQQGSPRQNYARLLLGVAILEIIVAIAAFYTTNSVRLTVLVSTFIFGYAFIKEGVPRLLYVVSVYNYFGDSKDYTRIAGLNSGLNILATLIGTLTAGWLLGEGTWKVALAIDALSFLFLAFALLYAGQDVPKTPPSSEVEAPVMPDVSLPQPRNFYWILLGVTLLPIANSLVWNYLPLLADRLEITSVSSSIALIALLRLPGMLAGFRLPALAKLFPLENCIKTIPVLNLIASVGFVIFPSVLTFGLLILVQGFVTGVYWPADYSTRNTIPSSQLVTFNTLALRRLAIFQMLACVAALGVFQLHLKLSTSVPIAIFVLATLSVLSLRFRSYKFSLFGIKIALTIAISILIFWGTAYWFQRDSDRQTVVLLPSVSRDLSIRSDLTFSSFAILNDVSAHLVRVSRDLTLEPEVMLRFERLNGGEKYIIHLNPEYKNSRRQGLDAYDVAFSFKQYLVKFRDVAGVLHSVKGAKNCNSMKCALDGIKVLTPYSISVELVKSDMRFIEKLSSPWLMVFKRDQPMTEKIGDCTVPYQMGRARIIACEKDGITIAYGNRRVLITKDKPVESNIDLLEIINNNPGVPANATLTVLTLFSNPRSSAISPDLRRQFTMEIRSIARNLSKDLRLNWAPLMTSRWLAIEPPDDLTSIKSPPITSCPKVPINVLLDTSLPDLSILQSAIKKAIPCPIHFSVTEADKYFENFAKSDFGIAWFSPDYLDLYNAFSAFDCAPGGSCYFNWKDQELQSAIDQLRASSENGVSDKDLAIPIERLLFKRGYAAPISEMNWWIKRKNDFQPIHPAGLGQISVSDFL